MDFERFDHLTRRQQIEGNRLLAQRCRRGVRHWRPVLIEAIQQLASSPQSMLGHTFTHGERLHAKVVVVRITLYLPRIVFRAEESGMLTGPSKRTLYQIIRQRNAGRNPVLSWSDEIECRGEIRKVVASLHSIQVRTASW